MMKKRLHVCDSTFWELHFDPFYRETMASRRGVYLYHKMTPPRNFGRFWLNFGGWSQILPWTKLFPMDLNKAVPWLRKSWRKRHNITMRMQNDAKLAAGAHQGYMATHMSKFLHWSVTAVPAASCAPAGIWGRGFADRGQNTRGEIWNCSLKFHHPQKFHHTPFEISAFANKWGNPPFQTHRIPMTLFQEDLSTLKGSTKTRVKMWSMCFVKRRFDG